MNATILQSSMIQIELIHNSGSQKMDRTTGLLGKPPSARCEDAGSRQGAGDRERRLRSEGFGAKYHRRRSRPSSRLSTFILLDREGSEAKVQGRVETRRKKSGGLARRRSRAESMVEGIWWRRIWNKTRTHMSGQL